MHIDMETITITTEYREKVAERGRRRRVIITEFPKARTLNMGHYIEEKLIANSGHDIKAKQRIVTDLLQRGFEQIVMP
jgi:hypothetical protein